MLFVTCVVDSTAEHIEHAAVDMLAFLAAKLVIHRFRIPSDKVADALDAQLAKIGRDTGTDAGHGLERLGTTFGNGTHRAEYTDLGPLSRSRQPGSGALSGIPETYTTIFRRYCQLRRQVAAIAAADRLLARTYRSLSSHNMSPNCSSCSSSPGQSIIRSKRKPSLSSNRMERSLPGLVIASSFSTSRFRLASAMTAAEASKA